MRSLKLPLALLLSLPLSACDAWWGADDTKIGIRLRTDGGTSAGVNTSIVTAPDGSAIGGRTGGDGKANMRVPGAGAYHVRIVPRAGFHGSEALRTSVSVKDRETTVVQFVLYRTGATEIPQPTGGN